MTSSWSQTVILIPGPGLGRAETPLQEKLLKTYLSLLLENDDRPEAICFYTEGVKMVADGSPVLEELTALERRGVVLISCLTCLNYFGLRERVRVGVVGGMGDILAAQTRAAKVITL